MDKYSGLEIAVIGLSIRVPGAKNQFEFWDNLKSGKESISHFTKEDLIASGIDEALVNSNNYIRAKGVIGDVEYFDNTFFNYTPKVASLMDPQIRLFHECVWEVFEDSGYKPSAYDGLVGIYAGGGSSFHWVLRNLYGLESSSQILEADNVTSRDYLATNVAYKLNLKGPMCTVQTACSTSLVAVHMACQSLLGGDCDIAIAGGVSITYPKIGGYTFVDGMISSRTGHIRTFDSKADGIVQGDGIGLVMLKRLDRAIADNDAIYAIIKGSAVNNDGNRKVDFTAPSVKGQAEVIQSAMKVANVSAESISYVEAHGTGTALGDPIEIEALSRAYNSIRARYCAIGSVKTNIGHLINAAGIVGFIKTVLALKHRTIPQSLHYKNPNPKINFDISPFYVADKTMVWNGSPLRAGVSSFGIGGTNAHVILEEAPLSNNHKSIPAGKTLVVLFSAKTSTALKNFQRKMADHILANESLSVADICFTLNNFRESFSYRSFVVAQDCKELSEELYKLEVDGSQFRCKKIVFMFSGQGSQYTGMARVLYSQNSFFRKKLDYCSELARAVTGINYIELIFGDSENPSLIHQTEYTQPVLFMIEYSIATMFVHWGVVPNAMIGHSIGEYVAATIAGIMTLEDAIRIVIKRGQLMAQTQAGKMIAVFSDVGELKELLEDEISIAAINSDGQVVLSGSTAVIERLEKVLEQRSIHFSQLQTSRAFHSILMDGILAQFEEYLGGFSFSKPEIPVVSNLSGEFIQGVTAKYWTQHLRSTVQFAAGIRMLANNNYSHFVEIGPGTSLRNIASNMVLTDSIEVLHTLSSRSSKDGDMKGILNTVGELWKAGVDIKWKDVQSLGTHPLKVSLPTYAFDKHKFWNDDLMKGVLNMKVVSSNKSSESNKLSNWFYQPVWREQPLDSTSNRNQKTKWIIFSNGHAVCDKVVNDFFGQDEEFVVIKQGTRYDRQGNTWDIIPADESHYKKLVSELNINHEIVRVLHCWTIGDHSLEDTFSAGYMALIYFVRELKALPNIGHVCIDVLSNHVFDVYDRKKISPAKSILMGPVKTFMLEYSFTDAKLIDIDVSNDMHLHEEYAVTLFAELRSRDYRFPEVLYRGGRRWVLDFAKLSIPVKAETASILKNGGNYIITGGTGGLGLEAAVLISQLITANIFLLSRRNSPDTDMSERQSDLKRKISTIKTNGSNVESIQCDVSDQSMLEDCIVSIERRFGKVDGVIHAAGVPDGTLVEMLNEETSALVFRPKVQSLLNIEKVFSVRSADFLILYSSVLSHAAQIGQTSYIAANNFLNVAAKKGSRAFNNVISINWDGWSETGMATDMSSFPMSHDFSGPIGDHPLFTQFYKINAHENIYRSVLDFDHHWILNEHMHGKNGVFPGTGFVEMVCYIAKRELKRSTFIINEIYFIQPLVVDSSGSSNLYTSVIDEADFLAITIFTFQGGKRVTHAVAQVSKEQVKPPLPDMSMKNIGKLSADQTTHSIPKFEGAMFSYGKRWDNISCLFGPNDEKFASLVLPAEFHGDMDHYMLHPALLDTATAYQLPFVVKDLSYVPFAYKSVLVTKPMVSNVFSKAIRIETEDSKELSFQVVLTDDAGGVIASIGAFVLRADTDRIPWAALEENEQPKRDSHKLTNRDGREILRMIFTANVPSEVIVSTVDFAERVKSSRRTNVEVDSMSNESSWRARKVNRSLETLFVAPENKIQERLAATWSDVLGIDKIGIDDNFFELGGDSVKAITISGKISSQGLRMSVSDIFTNPLIRELAEKLSVTGSSGLAGLTNEYPERPHYPASYSQRQIYAMHHFGNVKIAYNISIVYKASGSLDIERLKKAFHKLIDRNEVLRTSFKMVDNAVVQIIHSNVTLPFAMIDAIHEDIEYHSFIRPFDLTHPPLVALTVFKLSNQAFHFLFDIHHIIADGTSVGILIEELIELYEGKTLLPNKFQYKEFALWQQKYRESDSYREQRGYWLSLFPGTIPYFEFPTDFERPLKRSFSGRSMNWWLDESMTADVIEAAAKNSVSVFVLLLTAFSILAHKVTGQKSVLVGNNAGGRNHPEVTDMAGMFANTLPMLVIVDSEMTITGLLNRVTKYVAGALENQDYDFEDLTKDLGMSKTNGNRPLFNIVFNSQNFSKRIKAKKIDIERGRLAIEAIDFHNSTSKFDMIIFIHEEDDKIRIEFEYCDVLFTENTINTLAGEYISVIRQVVQNNVEAIADITIDAINGRPSIPKIQFNF
jgi:acyl transferase domain-containing protein